MGSMMTKNSSTNDDSSELASGDTITCGAVIAEKYRIEELIGTGGMGSVWTAIHLGLGERVAIKFIATASAQSKDVRQRFNTEAKAAAKLKSRFVVRVYDNGELPDGSPYIVMEHLEGVSLGKHVKEHGPMPLEQAVSVAAQVGRALARAHRLGIIHRDIKPDNIFLANSVDDGVIVKVLDFGIAKLMDSYSEDGETEIDATRTGLVLGSPIYMSPEQAQSLRTIDFRTDLYSLGLIVYFMLIGKRPFSGQSFTEMLLKICTQPLPKLCEANPSLPLALELWFEKCCARNPDERYASASECVEALMTSAGFQTSVHGVLGGSMSGSFSGLSGEYPLVGPPSLSSPATGDPFVSSSPSGETDSLRIVETISEKRMHSSDPTMPGLAKTSSHGFRVSVSTEDSKADSIPPPRRTTLWIATGAAVLGIALLFFVVPRWFLSRKAPPANIDSPQAATSHLNPPTSPRQKQHSIQSPAIASSSALLPNVAPPSSATASSANNDVFAPKAKTHIGNGTAPHHYSHPTVIKDTKPVKKGGEIDLGF
jgi:eukaryotic-like serine/threonine-protein kinase